MCLFKVSYIGAKGKQEGLKHGNVYDVEREIVADGGKIFFELEGIDGKYDRKDFFKLESRGFYYLNGQKSPKVGDCMRLVKKQSDTNEFMTGEVKDVENTAIRGIYRVCTDKCIYEVRATV